MCIEKVFYTRPLSVKWFVVTSKVFRSSYDQKPQTIIAATVLQSQSMLIALHLCTYVLPLLPLNGSCHRSSLDQYNFFSITTSFCNVDVTTVIVIKSCSYWFFYVFNLLSFTLALILPLWMWWKFLLNWWWRISFCTESMFVTLEEHNYQENWYHNICS